MYTIYEIPGVKIGCTKEVKKRIKSQGYDNFRILEEHSCIYEASARERELQKEYGYRVDRVPYHIMVANAKKGNAAADGGRRGGLANDYDRLKSMASAAGKIGGKKSGPIAAEILNKKRKTCPHCNQSYNLGNYARWHGDRCKLNPSS